MKSIHHHFKCYIKSKINNNMTESCNIINKIHILFAEKKTMWHVWSCTLLKCHDFNTIMSWLLCICCHLSVIYIFALCYCFEAWTRDANWGNKQYNLHRFITSIIYYLNRVRMFYVSFDILKKWLLSNTQSIQMICTT